MTADELRQASGEMRRLAEAATPGPWDATVYGVRGTRKLAVAPWDEHSGQPDMDNRLHIAAWHPAVALAVADSLIVAAAHIESHECEAHCEQGGCDLVLAAQRTARAFLGTTP